MRLVVSSVVLTLAWFAASNAVASMLAWTAARRLRRRSESSDREPTPQLLVAVRLAPVAIAAIVALVLFLPEHVTYESREGSETFGALLCGLALTSGLLFARSAFRVTGALRASRRLRRGWIPRGTADDRRIVDDAAMANVSLAGILRTTIVVGQPVKRVLTAEELDVAVAHEMAHRLAWDNLKRFAMFASPDFFGCTKAGRQLERQWSVEVECMADSAAVAGDPSRAASLAAALLKVARLASTATPVRTVPVWSTFHDQSVLELRVRRLVSGAAVPGRRPSRLMPTATLSLAVTAVSAAWISDLPRTLHAVSEVLVRLLP